MIFADVHRLKEARVGNYTVVRREEVDDVLGEYPGEMRMLTAKLGNEQIAFTYRRMPQHTGGKGSYGHRHRTQEEIVYVISGRLQFKLDDDVVDVDAGTAVRIPPETVRSIWNDEPEDAEIVIVSKRVDDPQAETEYTPDFWPR
jgi:quercetin dioxygenase-like cupin family protein